jgi:epsin
MPQPTGYGSNNPFAAGFNPSPTPAPAMPSFEQSSSFRVPSPQPPMSKQPVPQQQQRPPKNDGENARLAQLLGNGRCVLSPPLLHPVMTIIC